MQPEVRVRATIGGRCYKILRQFGLEARTKVVQQREAAIEDARGNDDVGVDGPIRNSEAAGECATPALGLAAGIFVANKERGADLFKKSFERIGGAADDECDLALGRVCGSVAQALLEKVVVPQVGVGVVGNHAEVDDDRQREKIGGFDCDLECGIVDAAHCALHPVDDANAVLAQWAAAAHQDAGLIGESGEVGSGFCRVGCGHHLRPQVSILNQRWAM